MLHISEVFSTHMVLQRDKEIVIFGETDKDKVNVSLCSEDNCRETEIVSAFCETYECEEVEDHYCHTGKLMKHFTVKLPALKAGGPYIMHVCDDNSEIRFSDIYIGEVWLAGGQSNMELELQNSENGKEVLAHIGEDEADKRVRFYYTPKVPYVGEELYRAESTSMWKEASTENSACWSAVGFYFAKALAKKLDCMIGIIGCNWGGTSASCWMSREKLLASENLCEYVNRYDEVVKNQDFEEYIKEDAEYKIYQAEFDKNVGRYYQESPNPTWDEAIALFGENRYPGPMGPRNFTRPAGLYESMLKRVAPYSLRGFIFYQGEEDDNRPYLYSELLSAMISQWREDWKDLSLPFINVQLPIYLDEGEHEGNHAPWNNWAFIREAQSELVGKVENYYMAVALDKGEYHNIHPIDKKTVGDRLALQALKNVYGENIKAEGPSFAAWLIEGNRVLLSFDNAEDGLVLNESKSAKPAVINADTFEVISEADRGEAIEADFEIAGEDKVYYQASEVIVGDIDWGDRVYQVMVYSSQVPNPKYVRYFWKNYGEVKLFGTNNIPVAPFRIGHDDEACAWWSRQGEIKEK